MRSDSEASSKTERTMSSNEVKSTVMLFNN